MINDIFSSPPQLKKRKRKTNSSSIKENKNKMDKNTLTDEERTI